MPWKDVTSYQRDKPMIPTAWAISAGDLSLTVLTGHLYYPDEWVMHFRPWFDTHPLGLRAEVPAEQAQEKALGLALAKLQKATDAFLALAGKPE